MCQCFLPAAPCAVFRSDSLFKYLLNPTLQLLFARSYYRNDCSLSPYLQLGFNCSIIKQSQRILTKVTHNATQNALHTNRQQLLTRISFQNRKSENKIRFKEVSCDLYVKVSKNIRCIILLN